MKQKLLALLLIVTALFVIGVAEASSDGQHAENGISRCSDSIETREGCLSFIKGFLKGALLTDAAILQSVEKDLPELSFSERAKRTRISSRLSAPTALAGFCLPQDKSIRQIAQSILAHIDDSESNSKELANNVYDTLKEDYPC